MSDFHQLYRSTTARIARLGPLAKLSVWMLTVFALAGIIQAIATMVSADFSILDKSIGSAVLIALSLFVLLFLVAIEGRPMADYAIVADKNWARHGLGGFALGLAVYGGFCLLAVSAGVFVTQFDQVTPYRCFKAMLAGASAIPVAVTQQILFSGFLLSTLRERHGRMVSVLLPAGLFALACSLSKLGGADTPSIVRLAIGMFLVATLLGMLRLKMGNLALGSGVLAGAICVRKVLGKTRLLGFDATAPLAFLLAPTGDPRQALAFWALLVGSIALTAYLLARYGERTIEPGDATAHASFKRLMPFSNLMAFAPLDVWLARLLDARLQVGIKYWPRLIVTLITSAITSVLSLPERILAPLIIRHEVPDPVFIVGMPRSGTTHLHNLLALDPQFRTPRNFEVFNPHGFLTGWLTTAVMAPLMSWRRPMDAVQMQVLSPQEEEFALACMGGNSPYWAFGFPRRIARHHRYWLGEKFEPRELRIWERNFRLFLRKLTLLNRRKPLLKNPANTGRLAMLKAMFPRAKFIHIYRDPYAVYRSNQHLAREGLVVFQLQDPIPSDNYETRMLANYRQLMDSLYRDSQSMEDRDLAEVRFEALETDPLEQVERIYSQLGIPMSTEYRARLDDYLAQVAGYRKNKFAPLPTAERLQVDMVMGPYFSRWGYERENLATADPKRAA